MPDDLRRWSGQAVAYPTNRTILTLFEDRAVAAPDRVAIVHGDTALTYAQLDQRANTLAHELRAHGVRRGDFVPLALDGGLELPLAMIAAMKIAAPFVPVDPAGPAARTAHMIESLGALVVVRSAGQPLGAAVHITLDALRQPATATRPDGPPAALDDTVYGFYTSGSTGTPKCAVNVHRGLLNRFTYMSRALSDRDDEVVLQNSRPQFDSSLWQLLWPLTTGSRVVIPERSGILDLPATIATIHRYGVTMTDFVPSIFNTLVELLHVEPELVDRLTTLRRLLIGGEEMTPQAVHAFRSMFPATATINTFGPTEASIGSVFHHVTDADGELIPIGRPIDNTYVVIVDDDLELVGPGEIGELCIGGDCLGRGYHADPRRTAAAFTANPFTEIPGGQLYRTGDLGYHGPDGLVYFVGRRDQQVKISGVRIELTEVETAILRRPGVVDAKIVVSADRDSRMLVGFVTVRTPAVDAAALMAHAKATLPATMVPRRFVVLDDMPLTPNGKADRRALVAITESWHAESRLTDSRPTESGRPTEGGPTGAAAPETDVRARLRALWLDLLPVADIDAGSDFFDLGGDSLTAQRLAIAMAERFGSRVAARDVFELPTFDAQVDFLDGTGRHRSRADHSDLLRDTILPPDIPAAMDPAAIDPAVGAGALPVTPAQVFVTGATGFIGAQLVHDLLTRTDAIAHCLVRGTDPAHAHQRIVDNLTRYRLWDPRFAERIVAVPGDLGHARLGLATGAFDALANTVDTIVHNGAMVNLARSYRAHRPANVAGTLDIIRLASTARAKPLHFLSTLGTVVIDADGPTGTIEGPTTGTPPPDGYSQSKWVAERLLEAAAVRGLPVAIYRVGEVMPHSRHGVPSRRGLADLVVKACVNTGSWFRSPIVMDYTQVECISGVVVAAVLAGESGHFHPVQSGLIRLDDLLAVFAGEYRLREVSYRDFRQALADRSGQPDLARLLALLPAPDDSDSDDAIGTTLSHLFHDDAAGRTGPRARKLMAASGLHWPAVGPEIFRRYAAYYRDSPEETT